jgi:hypothetical protein
MIEVFDPRFFVAPPLWPLPREEEDNCLVLDIIAMYLKICFVFWVRTDI